MEGTIRALQEIDTAEIRILATLEPIDFEIEYIREDLEEVYSETDLDNAYQLIMANQVSADDFRQLIAATNFEAQTLFFEEVVVCLFPSKRYEGVFASFDRSEPFPISDILDAAAEANV